MRHLDSRVIRLLRDMAAERRTVSEMVRALGPGHAAVALSPVDVVRSFREAFGLTLPQAKPVADWLAYGGGDQADSVLHNLVWPYIECNRSSWGREPAKNP